MGEQPVTQIADKLRECVVFFEGDDCAGGLICRAAVAELERLGKADYEFQSKLADGITDAFLERRWIPVSERLPEEGERVLGWRAGSRPGEVWLTSSGDWLCGDCEPAGGVTHWMPLPEPPEVK